MHAAGIMFAELTWDRLAFESGSRPRLPGKTVLIVR